MSQEVVDKLGASCEGSGSFYVCHDKPSKFLGCCTVDPCKTDDGLCPDDKLGYTTYDKYSHNFLTAQDCQSDKPEVQWFTCAANDVPFMGCCSVNACEQGECPDGKVFAAKLSDVEEDADIFLPEEARSTAAGNSDDGGLSSGAIGGIAAGAVVGGLLIIGALVFWFLRRRKAKKHDHQRVSTFDPYSGAPTIVGSPGPGSPGPQKQDYAGFSPVATPFSPEQQMAQHNAPGSPAYWQQQQQQQLHPQQQQSPHMHHSHVSMQSMSTHTGLGMSSPSPFTGSQVSPTPTQGAFNNRNSVQTAYTGNDISQQQHHQPQQFVSELPASHEFGGAGANNGDPTSFAAEMEAPDNRKT